MDAIQPNASTTVTITTPAVTPGWKTSEFWLAIGIHVINALIAADIIKSETWAKLAAIMSSTLVQISYQLSRSSVKPSSQSPPITVSNGTPPTISPAWLALLILPALLCVGGCQQTPLTQVMLAREAYTHTLDTLSTFREAGKISDSQYKQIELARVIAAQALDDAELNAVNGNKPGVQTALDVANKAIDQLITEQIKLERDDAAAPKKSTAPPKANTPAAIGGVR